MTDAGFIDDGEVAIYEARGMRASGYSVDADADETVLVLFLTDYLVQSDVRSLGKLDIDTAFRRLATFVARAHTGLWRNLEESSTAWDMAHRIEQLWPQLTRINLVLLTNAHAKGTIPDDSTVDGVPCTHHVWDLQRLYRLASSGRQQEPITVDLAGIAGAPLPCLGPAGPDGDYQSYLLLIPGPVLADVYDMYRARLLELNVRSFLQARGKINRGIQATLRGEPARFLAYNNGISITASSVDVVRTETGQTAIAAVHDLQIVNGGQTTASLHYARTKTKLDISRVLVQAKISVVESENLQELVPRISEFANSQNPVRMADFSASDTFHVELEKLSRSIWAPGRDGSNQMTRWFYERARGQYADALAAEHTPARRRQFQLVHPLRQKMSKTDIAKFENIWDQQPHIACLGAEKSFREFALRLKSRTAFKPDEEYFHRLVAKALLFRTAETLVGDMKLGQYRAQDVAYTLSLISRRTAQRIDLEGIWKAQRIPDLLVKAIETLAPQVHAVLVGAAEHANVGEWAKKEACWEQIQQIGWEPDESLISVPTSVARSNRPRQAGLDDILTPAEQAAMDRVVQVPADVWFSLASWAKETDNLAGWQRSLAVSLGRLQSNDRAPSRKQAAQGDKILQEAHRLGFAVS